MLRILEVAVGNYVGYIWCLDLNIRAMYWQRHLIWHKQVNMPVIYYDLVRMNFDLLQYHCIDTSIMHCQSCFVCCAQAMHQQFLMLHGRIILVVLIIFTWLFMWSLGRDSSWCFIWNVQGKMQIILYYIGWNILVCIYSNHLDVDMMHWQRHFVYNVKPKRR